MNSSDIKVTSEQSHLDQAAVIRLLRQTHFASQRSDEAILKSLETSLCFGAFLGGRQVGFGRVITQPPHIFAIWPSTQASEARE
jgi:hypothetical protein